MITKRQKALSVLATLITLTASQAEAVRVGPQGPIGLTGAQGIQGIQGIQGVTGSVGATGPAGSNGSNGSNGSSFVYSMTCGAGGTDACKIGAVGPGGGWIFFVDYNDQYTGFDYLEAAATDIALVAWCVGGTDSTASIYSSALSVSQYWVLNRVGTGSVNTAAMKAACTSGAAYSATAYVSSPVKTDWFLGSEGEMMLMYTNLRQAGVGGFADNYYWSSTEYSSTIAWFQFFLSGYQDASSKGDTYLVRAVRAF